MRTRLVAPKAAVGNGIRCKEATNAHFKHNGVVERVLIKEGFTNQSGRILRRQFLVLCVCGKELYFRSTQFEVVK